MMTQFAVLAARLAGVGRRAPVLAVLAGLTASQWPSATASYAQRRTERRQTEEWVLLSSREIDRKGSQETIDVRAARGQVKAVRLIARRNALELTQIKVTYGDGRVHDENRNINLNPNDRTRPIESGGTEHFVDAIELAVRPARSARGSDQLTTIEVWGLQTPAGARAERTPVAPSATADAAATAAPPGPVPAPPLPATAQPPVRQAAPLAPAVTAMPPPSPTPASRPAAQVATAPDAGRPVPSPSPLQPAPAATAGVPAQPTSTGAAVAGPPGTAPPLPPPRGPQAAPGRVAALPRVSPPVPPAVVGDEAGDGIFLGRRTITPAADRDIVAIGVEIAGLARLRLRILDAGLRFDEVTLNYASGAPDVVVLKADVPANSPTHWLRVSPDRLLREVEVSYGRRDGARAPATVEIYGEPGDGYLDPGGEATRMARYGGWVPLGAKTSALRNGHDQFDFQIGRNKGGFRKLRVDAKERAITLREVRVIYATGEDEVFAIDSSHQRIAAGASFGPIALRGSSRAIKGLVLKTRSKFLDSDTRGKDSAIVEVWGQH